METMCSEETETMQEAEENSIETYMLRGISKYAYVKQEEYVF